MKQINLNTEAKYLKALIYGRPGTGKTSFGVSAPRPLILLSEGHAAPHIRDAARRLGRPDPIVLTMDTADDYRDVLRALHGSKDKPFVVRSKQEQCVVFQTDVWPETVVLDSVTDAMQVLIDEIRIQSPQKDGKDGLPVDSERFWGALTDRATGLIRGFRDAPMHVLFLALLDDRMIGEGPEASRWVGPQMPMRKLPGALQAAVNVVGVTFRDKTGEKDEKTGERVLEYGINTSGPNFMELKPFPPLRAKETTDFTDWVRRVHGDAAVASTLPQVASQDSQGAEAPGDADAATKAPTKRQKRAAAPDATTDTATDSEAPAA